MRKRFGMLSIFLILLIALTAAGCASSSKNGDFPSKDITFIIPNAPGGTNDLTVRALIPGMEKQLEGTVVPENKPASGGAVALVELAEAEPDGHQIYFNSQTLIIMAYSGSDEIQVKNYQPVAQVVEDSTAFYVPANSPYNSLQEFIADAKKKPGKLKIATNGKGALWHLTGLTFAKAAGIELQYVPYTKGGAEMATAVASGEADIASNSPAEIKALVDGGKLKVLAVQSEQRHPLLPDAPTTKEAGLDFEVPIWRGVFTTAGVDEPTLKKLEQSVKTAMETDEFKKFLETNGMPAKFRGYAEFSEFVKKEDEKYKQLLTEIGMNK